jgi:signal transduction histidine kinase/ActR/RegA family two-component response regulator
VGLTKTILNAVGDVTSWGILTTDARLNITGWNQWLENNSGISAAAVVGRHLLEVFSELGARRMDSYYRQALSGQMVVLAQRLHGFLLPLAPSAADTGLTMMPQSARIAPLFESERVVGTLTVIEDVTERVLHEAALQARAREQAAVAALSRRALAGEALDVLLRETATALADVLGGEYSQVLALVPEGHGIRSRAGAGWKEVHAGAATVPAEFDALERFALNSGGAVIIEDLASEARFHAPPLLREFGVTSAVCVPILNGKKTFGALAVFTSARRTFKEENVRLVQAFADVLGFAVERVFLEHQLRQRANDLVAESRRKDEFLAMLAHELRNPLAPIRNAVQIIRSAGDANPIIEHAGGIVDRQVQQLVRLVDDLLDVSRISQGKVQLRKEKIDLASIATRAIESARPLIDKRQHQLTLNLPSNPVWLEGDRTRMVQILANLLNNAAKYTDAGGHIWLTAEREGNEAVLRVRDNGIGIRADLLPRIFDLFVQSDRALDRSEGGLGIGLTLARNLVEMHGGKITASSGGLGQGSEFIVRLPTLSDTGPQQSSELAAHELRRIHPTARRRILVVDDNVDSAVSLSMLLEMKMHEVHVAHDGMTALAEIKAFLPEVVFLDIGLPRMDGFEVARRVRQEYSRDELVLVAMTGYGQEEDRRRSQEAGFDGHLVKPIDLDIVEGFLKRTGPAGPSGS